MELILYLLLAQTVLGAFDTIYHHELTVALPRCPTAGLELRIHSVRSLLYALLFAGLAWYEWHGLWAWILAALIVVEVVLTLWDFVVEDQTRSLPSSERITHTLLALNGGAVFMLLAQILLQWMPQESALQYHDYGWISWLLTLSAAGVGLSGIRDALAEWNLPRIEAALKLDLGRHHKLLISGGTGFIGSALCRELLSSGHDLTLVSRRPVAAALQFAGRVRVVGKAAELAAEENFDAIINLAGAPVAGMPWTQGRRAVLLGSRSTVTNDLLAFVRTAKQRPPVWLQASAIGYYGTHSATALTEQAPAGTGFAAELCHEWEQLSVELQQMGIRRVVLRFGLVFGRSGGALPMLVLPFRFGLGSIVGSGTQHVAWIHIEDLLRLLTRALTDPKWNSEINAVAPECPDYATFARLVGQLLLRPVWLRFPADPLRFLLGEMASLFVDGPRIVPQRVLDTDFNYNYPTLRSALMDLV